MLGNSLSSYIAKRKSILFSDFVNWRSLPNMGLPGNDRRFDKSPRRG